MQYQKASEKIDQVLQNGYISEIMFDNDFWRTVKSAVDDKIAADETVKQKRKALTRAYAELGEMLVRTQMTNSDEFNQAICVALQCIENELKRSVN